MKKFAVEVKQFLRRVKRFHLRNFVKKKYIPVYIVACLLFFFVTGLFVFDMIYTGKSTDPIENANRAENPEVLDTSNIVKNLSSDYPTVTSVKDGIGNVNYSSFGQGNMDYWKNPSIRVEDVLNIAVVVNNPKGMELSYKYDYQTPGGAFQSIQDWSSSNNVVFTVPENATGRWLYIRMMVKDSDSKFRFDGCDDYTYLVYEVNPKDVNNKIYPVIENTGDDKGNVNTNSWGANEGGSWPDGLPKYLNVADTVIFTIKANDPNKDSMQYRFEIQVDGGSFSILKDWGSESSYTWVIPDGYSGKKVNIMASVRDGDKYLLFNDSGDDYNYMIYTIK